MTDDAPPLLETSGLTKRFSGTLALDNVDLDFRPATCTPFWARTVPASRP